MTTTVGSTGITFNDATVQTTAYLGGSVIGGWFRRLKLSTTGLNSNVTITADAICVEDTSYQSKVIRNISVTASTSSSGAGGLDTGTIAISTWYAVWLIYNPTTNVTKGLLSLSSTSPTLPSGYTMKTRIGWIKTDSTTNKYPLPFGQYNNNCWWKAVAGSNQTSLPVEGVAAGSYATKSVAAVFPPTAISCTLKIYTSYMGDISAGPNSSATVLQAHVQNTGQSDHETGSFYFDTPQTIYYGLSSSGTILYYGWMDDL